MATYVLLLKKYEDDELVIYEFGPDKEKLGEISLNKKTKEYKQLRPVPNTQSNFYYFRAVSCLLKCLESNGGVFPSQTHFAS